MNLIKTNLVQALENTQEMNEMIALIEGYKKEIINSMAVPSKMLGVYSENSPTTFQSKLTMIKIDITKLP